jgi:hypothetical protein
MNNLDYKIYTYIYARVSGIYKACHHYYSTTSVLIYVSGPENKTLIDDLNDIGVMDYFGKFFQIPLV